MSRGVFQAAVFWTEMRDEDNSGKKLGDLQRFAPGDGVAGCGVLGAISGTGTATNGHYTNIGE